MGTTAKPARWGAAEGEVGQAAPAAVNRLALVTAFKVYQVAGVVEAAAAGAAAAGDNRAAHPFRWSCSIRPSPEFRTKTASFRDREGTVEMPVALQGVGRAVGPVRARARVRLFFGRTGVADKAIRVGTAVRVDRAAAVRAATAVRRLASPWWGDRRFHLTKTGSTRGNQVSTVTAVRADNRTYSRSALALALARTGRMAVMARQGTGRVSKSAATRS